jgi:hypothetical protein
MKRIGLLIYEAILLSLACYALIFSSPVQRLSAKKALNDQATTVVAMSPVFTESLEGSTRLRTDQIGNLYVLNTKDSSILAYDRSFKFLRRIGSFGQGPDDINHPSDFTIDRNGQLIVADTENNRIQILSAHGKSVRSFKVDRPWSVDVLSTGEILVVGARDKELIRVFSAEGKILSEIGELAPTGVESQFPELHFYLNRGSLLVDPQDNIYWASNNLPNPTVRKYSREGKLLLEFHPTGRALEGQIIRAKQELQQSLAAHQVRAKAILHAVQVDRKSGDIWVLPAAPELLIYDAKGNFKRAFTLKTESPIGGWDVLLLGDGRFIVSNRVDGCYLFKAPRKPEHASVAKRGRKRR